MGHGYPDERYETVEEAAELAHTVPELQQLAKLMVKRPPTRKGELVKLIAGLLEGEGLRRVWERLDDVQRAAVAEVVYSGEASFDEARFHAKHHTLPDWGRLQAYGRDANPTPLRLILFGGVLPDDLRERLRVFVPPPPAPEMETIPAPKPPQDVEADALVVHASEHRARRELLAVLRLVDLGRVSVAAKSRKPTRAAMKHIGEVLEGGDFYAVREARSGECSIRAFAWPMLLQAGRLVTTNATKLALTKAGRKALASAPEDTLRTLWRRWLASTMLDELRRVEAIKGQQARGRPRLVALRERRRALVDGFAGGLAGATRDAWFTPAALRRYMVAAATGFRVAHDPWRLYMGDARYGSFGYEDRSDLLDHCYLTTFLFEYAATLGLFDVAYVPPEDGALPDDDGWWMDMTGEEFLGRYDGLIAARPTPLGAWCLGLEDSYTCVEAQPEAVLRVLPDCEIVALAEALEPADRMALDAFAARTSERSWRLGRRSLLAGFQSGRPVGEVRTFLEARSANPLPDTVARLLEETEARTEALADEGLARLLACRDADVATLIAHHAKTRRHCRLAGEHHLVVPEASESAFRRGLLQAGYALDARTV